MDPRKGPVLLNYGLDECRFTKPVYPGTTIGVTLTVKEKVRPGKARCRRHSQGYRPLAGDRDRRNRRHGGRGYYFDDGEKAGPALIFSHGVHGVKRALTSA
ncbi:MAG: hypothetical protein WKG07_04325 [Hymenobacter sp.]